LVSILIVTHGEMAQGMLSSMRMIAGDQKQVGTVALEEAYSPEYLKELLQAAINELDDGDGVLIMVDLFGATPFNASMQLYLQSDHQIEIITGVNLPMLIETAISRANCDLETIFHTALNAGTSGIKTIPETLRKK